MEIRDIEIYRGDDKSFTFAFTLNDAPFDVSDGRLDMAIVARTGEIARLSSETGTDAQVSNGATAQTI